MTTYNTGNPIGSTDPRDLSDNAENLDEAVNTRTAESWNDRFGVARKTWHGMEQDFKQFLINSGYQNIGDYGPGLEITARNQIFWRDGELYRSGAALELPYTTTGDWGDEEGLFVAVGDQALRKEITSTSLGMGAFMIGNNVISVSSNNVYSLIDLPEDARKEGSKYLLNNGASYVWMVGDFPLDEGIVLPVGSGAFVADRVGALGPIVITVGDSGDFPSLKSAIKFASTLNILNNEFNGQIEIRMLSGFEWAEQLYFHRSSLAHIVITSEDEFVSVRRDSITTEYITGTNRFAAMSGLEANLPALGCLLIMDETGDQDSRIYGIQIYRSSMTELPGCGIRNVPGRGINNAHASTLIALRADFQNCGDIGIRTSHNSRTHAREAVLDGCNIGCSTSQSIANFQYASIKNTTQQALGANGGAVVYASNLVATGACTIASGDIGTIDCSGGAVVSAPNANLSGSLRRAIFCEGSGRVYAENANLNNAALHAILARREGVVNARDSQWDSSGDGILSTTGGVIRIPGSTGSSSGSRAIRVLGRGSLVEAAGVTITSATGSYAVEVDDGGRVDISGGTLSGLNTSTVVCRVASSSTLIATDCDLTERPAGTQGVLVIHGSEARLDRSDIRRNGNTDPSDISVGDESSGGNTVYATNTQAGSHASPNTIGTRGIYIKGA